VSATDTTTKTGLKIIRGKAGRDLLRAAEQAYTPTARAKLEKQIEKLVGEVEWKIFGGGERSPHSAIGATGDALHLVGEPIVNQGDALIELEHELAVLKGDTHEPISPQEAAHLYFGLPPEGMAEWNTREKKARALLQKVAMLSQLLIHAGSNKGEATLVFIDSGIGQHPLSFKGTVLSLQKALKAEIPYLAGAYGHGAGMTLGPTNGGQILIGRRHPKLLDHDQDDLVGLTIVRKFAPSEVHATQPAYLYIVDKETGQPIAFEPSALSDPRWHGLRRICIDYEAGAAADKIGDQASGGFYYNLDNLLPAPSLPYALRDERGSSPQWRYMQGNASRLTARAKGWAPKTGKNPIDVTGPIKTNVDVTAAADDGHEYGDVEINVWVVEQENTGRGNELFGPPSSAETWSLNGQMHSTRPREHFAQKPIELDALKNYLKVNVECDGLNVDAKSEIFTTGRQGTTERRAKGALATAIDSVLANNPQLRDLDRQKKEEALRKATEGADRELEAALNEFQHFFEREVDVTVGDGTKKQKRKKKGGKAPKIEPLKPIKPLHTEPTFLRFRKVVRDKLKLRPGATSSVLLEADAVDAYFPDREKIHFATAPDLGSKVRVYARERLAGGRMRIHFRTAEDATPGKSVLTASCLPASASGPLTDSIDIEIVSPKTGPGDRRRTRKEKKKVAPPHRVLWKEDPKDSWESAKVNWTEDTVGEFKDGVALVNGDFTPFREMLDQIKTSQQKSVIRLYAPPLVMSLVGLDKRKTEPPIDSEDNAVVLHETYEGDFLRTVALGSIFTIRRLKKMGLGIDDAEAAE
jgi:hypothetical protein